MTWWVVGLGNPGALYENTRHNVGFQFIDTLAHLYGFGPFELVQKCQVLKVAVGPVPLSLVKAQVFMNLSGHAIGPLLRFYKTNLDRVLLVHDDLDLPLGAIRVKQGGGSGGHRGIQNVDAHIGAAYWRLRIGIGRPEQHKTVPDYVLEPFMPHEHRLLRDLYGKMACCFPHFLQREPLNRSMLEAAP